MNDEKYRPWISLQAAEALVKKQVGDDQNSATDSLLKAATGITEAATRVQETVPQILGNRLGSALANAQAARRAVDKIVEPALRRAGEAADFTSGAIERLTAKTDPTAPVDVVAAMMHQEVRLALLRMSSVERRKAIATAISSGDETFLAAATSGSPTLSGMSAAEQSAAREQWRKKRHPEDAARIARLRNGLTQLDRLGPMLQKWADQIVEEPAAAAVAAAEATAAAARKAAG
jgi:hypothetical protein